MNSADPDYEAKKARVEHLYAFADDHSAADSHRTGCRALLGRRLAACQHEGRGMV
jgi:hypothetical protein